VDLTVEDGAFVADWAVLPASEDLNHSENGILENNKSSRAIQLWQRSQGAGPSQKPGGICLPHDRSGCACIYVILAAASCGALWCAVVRSFHLVLHQAAWSAPRATKGELEGAHRLHPNVSPVAQVYYMV
jgi:hypothetical protein